MDILQKLESEIAHPSLLYAAGVPSASIAILSDGKISTRVITSGAENEETIYQACSISKAITGIAVAKLVQGGRLSYSTPVTDHLPQQVIDTLVDKETAYLLPLVTVAMLLSHTSGLSQHGFPGYEGDAPTAEIVLSGEPPSNTPRVRFLTFPGAQFSYCGGGFTVLQVFLETLLGKPFAQLMQDLVLGPLGMTRSHYGALLEGEKNYTDAYYTAYTRTRAGHHVLSEMAAGGLWTTPSDLLKAVIAVQRSLHSNNGFLHKDIARLMLKPKMAAISEKDCISHGWFVTDTAFGHAGGNDPGYRCHVIASHGGSVDMNLNGESEGSDRKTKSKDSWDAGQGIVIMTNSVTGIDAYSRILSAIFYLKGWLSLTTLPCWPFAADWVPYAAPSGTPVEVGWQDWVGEWQGGWKFQARDGKPVFGFKDAGLMDLRPAAAPVRLLENGKKEIGFVVVGLQTAVFLSWEEEERVLRWVQWQSKVLRRA